MVHTRNLTANTARVEGPGPSDCQILLCPSPVYEIQLCLSGLRDPRFECPRCEYTIALNHLSEDDPKDVGISARAIMP